MKTLIELYDELPIENVLASDTFHPDTTVFLCPSEVAQDRSVQSKMNAYFAHRGVNTQTVFLDTSLFYANKVKKQLRHVLEEYPDCAIDIAGGSDAALFAAGYVSKDSEIPVFTHSRKKQKFFNISNAEFAQDLPFTVKYSVEDFFLMAGGNVKQGRVDNRVLAGYNGMIDPFFNLFFRYRPKWKSFITWMQRASASDKNGRVPLEVSCAYSLKGDRGSRIAANESILRDLSSIGFLKELKIVRDQSVSFRFRDEQVRYWLRDQGSVLEIYTWKACCDAGIFNDVQCSTIVEWDSTSKADKVSNEIDVMAVRDTIPVFISCKTCPVDTDAINELAILRDRFGGNAAKAIIVTTEKCRAITRQRAESLGINIIDMNDIIARNLSDQFREL